MQILIDWIKVQVESSVVAWSDNNAELENLQNCLIYLFVLHLTRPTKLLSEKLDFVTSLLNAVQPPHHPEIFQQFLKLLSRLHQSTKYVNLVDTLILFMNLNIDYSIGKH